MTARDLLRSATAEDHRRIDEHPWILDLIGGRLGKQRYTELLRGYHSWFAAWEASLKKTHQELIEALGPFRFEKTLWLEEDLARLDAPTADRFQLAFPAHPGALAGALYVIEGSTLGGAHLARIATFPEDAGRFYRGYGAETGPAWKAFLEWLESALVAEEPRREAVEAARSVFRQFESVINEAAERGGV